MKRSSLYLSTVDPLAGDLARAWGLGIEVSEFCTAWNLDDRFSQTDPIVRRTLQGISRATLHGPFNELFPCAIDPKARALAEERFLQTIAVARGYGIRRIIFHAGYDPHLYYPQWFIPKSVEFFRQLLKQVPEDVTICLENVLEEEPGLITEVIRQVEDPRLRMCLDVGHAQAYSRYPADYWVRACSDVLAHFHIHNNDGRKDLHGPLYEGVIPMASLLSEIETCCPRATLTLELPSARSSLDWLQREKILEAI